MKRGVEGLLVRIDLRDAFEVREAANCLSLPAKRSFNCAIGASPSSPTSVHAMRNATDSAGEHLDRNLQRMPSMRLRTAVGTAVFLFSH